MIPENTSREGKWDGKSKQPIQDVLSVSRCVPCAKEAESCWGLLREREREWSISSSVISSEGQVAGVFILQILSIIGREDYSQGGINSWIFLALPCKGQEKAHKQRVTHACRRMLIACTGSSEWTRYGQGTTISAPPPKAKGLIHTSWYYSQVSLALTLKKKMHSRNSSFLGFTDIISFTQGIMAEWKELWIGDEQS